MNDLFIQGLTIDWNRVRPYNYVRQIPAISGIDTFTFHKPITFFVGENGSGKSTLLEAIAVAYGFNAEGGTKNYSFSTYNSHSELCEAMTISKGYRRPKFGYFLRAESFYNVATKEIDYSDDDHPSKGYHQKSHGESFLAIAQDYMGADGVYIFDEPEAALSPQRQLTLLINIYRCAQEGAQFIIVSHSPILLGMPDAEIFSFDNGTIHPCQYEDTDSYVITKTFVNNRQHFLNQLLNEETQCRERTFHMSDSTLKELWQQVAEKKSCEAKQKELTAQRDTLADRLKMLEKSKLAEQADVDRLEGHSLAAFFYQVIGKMDEKLDKERQEAYAARVKYDVALHDLSSVDADLAQIQNRLARLSDCERQYQAALSEKIKSLKASAHPAAQQVAESESRIAALKVQKRELLEAIHAGKTALHTVNEVLETLDNAEGWSTWDVMGGGLGVDLAKYAELDDAQEQIEQLQVELRRFKTELSDVEIAADLQVTVDSFLKFADFFFDGLFADWAVLDHINQAQSRVENTKGQIKRVLALLKKMREDVDVQIADEKEKQEQLAVETEL